MEDNFCIHEFCNHRYMWVEVVVKIYNKGALRMNEITEEDIYSMIKNAVSFPFPQICKHLVAMDLLSMLEKKGFDVSSELAKALCEADDERAVEIINGRNLI